MKRIACQTITWGAERNSNDLAGVLQEVKRAGYDGVEIGGRYLKTDEKSYYQELLGGNGLELTAVHVAGNFLDKSSVAEQIKNIDKTVKLAKELNAGFIFISGFYKENKRKEDYLSEISTYITIGKLCASYGLRLCFHNHNWEFENNMEGIYILLNNIDTDLLNLVPDVGWITRAGADPVAFLKDEYDRVAAVHFKEYTSDGVPTELGNGIVNFKGVFEALAAKEDFWIIAEQDQTDRSPAESVKMNYEYIRKLGR